MRDQIRAFLQETFRYDPALVQDEESLMDTGVLDSVSVLVLVTWIESTFQIVVADDDVVPENLDSVARLSAYVQRKGGPSAGT